MRVIFNVFFLSKKCVSITMTERVAPSAVASPAPNIPISNSNTKSKSPTTLNIPPNKTDFVARLGALSFLKKAANICVKGNTGIAYFTGVKYSFARDNSLSSAPNR